MEFLLKIIVSRRSNFACDIFWMIKSAEVAQKMTPDGHTVQADASRILPENHLNITARTARLFATK